MALSGDGEKRRGHLSRPFGLSRRDFLLQGASAALLPAALRHSAFASAYRDVSAPLPAEFHLHPHYRTPRPLDAWLLKAAAGSDQFVTEKYAVQIGAILAQWSAGLLRLPGDLKAVEDSLAQDFSGASFKPVESKVVRSGGLLEVHKNKFGPQSGLARQAFLDELRSSLGVFSRILTAEFEISGIEAGGDAGATVTTRVRYDVVGTGDGFYREQRTGHWELEWVASSSSSSSSSSAIFKLRRWRNVEETLSRAGGAVFADITAAALGANSSYEAQLLRGTDYWRTVLDGASGIDIYGHNGVSVGDIDDDGFDDLYICQPAGLPNRLYRNRGDGTFQDITESSGVGILENTACALFADVDNDGRQDLIVVRTSGPALFLNLGGGKFRQKPDAFQFANLPQGTFTGAAIADYDRDGWLDIYFCLYLYYQGTDQYQYPTPYFDAQNGPPNFLMHNQRDGTFRDVTAQTGLDKNNTRYSFCCGWSDYNRDGWPDLYVVNDFGRKNLYRNNGDGTFTDVAAAAGVEDVGAGMSVCWFDYDNDGAEDLYVADMWTAAGNRVAMQEAFQKSAPEKVRELYRKHAHGNSLFRNRGDGSFQDASATAGVEMGRWSWDSDAWDFDHDGFPDLYIANGMVSGPPTEESDGAGSGSEIQEGNVSDFHKNDLNSFFWRQVVANSPSEARPAHDYEQGWSALNELLRADGTWSGNERNVFYANNRDGSFFDASGAVGLDFIEDGRSFALADFDHDGRLEIFLKNRNAPQLRVLKNVAGNLPPSISFRLRGTKANRDAIGAAVTIETQSGRQTRMLQAGSGFLAQHSKEVFFGLGDAKGPVRATVRWPSGLVQELRDLPVGHRIWIEEGGATRTEPFRAALRLESAPTAGDTAEAVPSQFPSVVETWLLAPVAPPDFSLPDLTGRTQTLSARRGKPLLLHFWTAKSSDEDLRMLARVQTGWAAQGLQLLTVNVDNPPDDAGLRALAGKEHFSFPILRGTDDVAGVYNILYRYLFDRHRDLSLPTSFLIDAKGDIVKVYQGPVQPERIEEDCRQIPQTAAQRLAKALPFPGVTDVSEFPRNYLSYGSVFYQRGYFEQSEAAFRLALRDDPSSAEALYGLGSACLQEQKTAEARECFERAVKLRGTYPETLPNAWNNLGLLAMREGHPEQAVEYFQQALRLSPDHLVALDNLGNAYRQQKRWEDARTTLQRAVEVAPEDPEANYSLGMVFAQLDDSDQAYQYLQRALQARPDYPEALNNLGVLYLRTRRRDDAVASFEECIRVAPEFDQSYLNLARVYALENQAEKARTVLLELLKRHPGHPQGQSMLQQLPR
ncbi:MAG TPA: FG-GAP-like repeat-containing protein [Terriglobales bacterium]|nr:FG-GAP-like repeat-containing protein [Terriglobales bacterium]